MKCIFNGNNYHSYVHTATAEITYNKWKESQLSDHSLKAKNIVLNIFKILV
jgi:hypothetical protein